MPEKRYRALIGVPALSLSGETKPNMRLSERTEIQRMCVGEAMEHWSTTRHVAPYPLPSRTTPDADALARRMLRGRRDGATAESLLRDWGRSRHIVFLSRRPDGCESDARPFGQDTGLLAYSVANPDGYYDSWRMPITRQWNDISVESCKLASTSYGTYHDMLYVADVAWVGTTFMPDVAFCAMRDGEGGIAYEELFRDDQPTKVWEHDLQAFFQKRLGLYGTIAMVECSC